jgi:hypothetical protein
MSLDRFVPAPTARAVDRLEQSLVTAFEIWGAPVEVFLAVAGDEAAVEHGLGRVPDGYLPILVVGGNVQASRPHAWTETTAYLVADANATRAIVVFVTCRKEIRNG